jgi:hypothetical protein
MLFKHPRVVWIWIWTLEKGQTTILANKPKHCHGVSIGRLNKLIIQANYLFALTAENEMVHKTLLNVDAASFLLLSGLCFFSGSSFSEIYVVEVTPFLLYVFRLLGVLALFAAMILHYSTTMAPHER